MARYTGAINKKQKKYGLLPESPIKGRQNTARRKSVYGIRLEEKQKLKFIYGLLEKQFRRYFNDARKDPHNTGFVLMQMLELRLDNVVYRLGFAPTRRAARQLVNHGHVIVNDTKVDIPSYSTKPGDVITLKPRALEYIFVQESLKKAKEENLASWLAKKETIGHVKSAPSKDDIRSDIDLQLIIEYYSR